jgi:hypothetical protein
MSINLAKLTDPSEATSMNLATPTHPFDVT